MRTPMRRFEGAWQGNVLVLTFLIAILLTNNGNPGLLSAKDDFLISQAIYWPSIGLVAYEL